MMLQVNAMPQVNASGRLTSTPIWEVCPGPGAPEDPILQTNHPTPQQASWGNHVPSEYLEQDMHLSIGNGPGEGLPRVP
jgi:hypothetical protein